MHTKNQCVGHIKWVNYVIYKLYLNNDVLERETKEIEQPIYPGVSPEWALDCREKSHFEDNGEFECGLYASDDMIELMCP